MDNLLDEVRSCIACKSFLPFYPKPIIQASPLSKILIIGQAPGLKVQNSGIPWDDQSGNELRRWLNVTKSQFYNPDLFALMPMGFCYPGKGSSGDLPPRPECAPLWHQKMLAYMNGIKLTILIGQYAQKYYLKDNFSSILTENVKNHKDYLPNFLPLVHPSPRNRIWQKKNPWFEDDVLPLLQSITQELIIK